MREFLQNIFSISDYGETHHLLRLFGLKIKFPKREYARKRKEAPYYYYKKNNIDITTIPPATGQIRDIQLGNLALLKEFDYVCRKNNLNYWLDYGTLLGAYRHKGFIPWDDDVDVSMMKEDCDKLIETFSNDTRNSDMYAEYTYLGKSQAIIKIKHRKCPSLFVDIFPHYYSNERLEKSDRIKKTKHLKKLRTQLSKDKNLDSVEKILNKVGLVNSVIIADRYVDHSDIQSGLEFFYHEPIWVYSYDDIFPLKEIEFEGQMFCGVNNLEKYLSEILGDGYMNYPKRIGFGHNAYANLDNEIETIRELAK